MDEQQQIRQAQRGDQQALADLLHRNYSFLFKYMLKMTMNYSQAEDLVQETMLRCIEKIHLYNGKSKFSSWLITIATRLYIDLMRRRKREQQWMEQEQSLKYLQWQMNKEDEDWPEVLQALGRLSYDSRLPIVLRHYYGYSYEEIARMMDVPAGTVKSRIHNGMHNIRKELKVVERQSE